MYIHKKNTLNSTNNNLNKPKTTNLTYIHIT